MALMKTGVHLGSIDWGFVPTPQDISVNEKVSNFAKEIMEQQIGGLQNPAAHSLIKAVVTKMLDEMLLTMRAGGTIVQYKISEINVNRNRIVADMRIKDNHDSKYSMVTCIVFAENSKYTRKQKQQSSLDAFDRAMDGV